MPADAQERARAREAWLGLAATDAGLAALARVARGGVPCEPRGRFTPREDPPRRDGRAR